MIQNLIIPVDISTLSERSIEYALIIDKSLQSLNISIIGCGYEEDAVKNKVQELLNKYKARFSEQTKIDVTYANGKFHEEIAVAANSKEDPLILMSSHKDIKNRDFFTIQDVIKLVDAAKQHVINLPENDFSFTINKIVFPVHTQTRVRHKATFTSKVAKNFNAGVDIVSTLTTSKEKTLKMCRLYTQQVANHYKSTGIPISINSSNGKNLASIISTYAKESNGDLISMIPEDNKDIRLFSVSYIEDLLSKSETPILIIAGRKVKYSGSFSSTGG
jgi:hypothetical protein